MRLKDRAAGAEEGAEPGPVQTTCLEVQGRILQERARGGLLLIVVLAFLAGVAAVWLLA
jgi:hypothetical protein